MNFLEFEYFYYHYYYYFFFCSSNQHDYGPYCARKWFHRCGTPLHSIFFERLYLQPFQENLRRFCQPNGTIQNGKQKQNNSFSCF